MPIAMGGLALVTFIPTYFAANMGLGLSVVGAVFVFGRILDVFTDPLIGYLSDRTQSRWGARRPWMLLSLPFYCAALWMLLSPPETVTIVYLIAASALYFLSYTALDVPYSAVGVEYSSYVHERSTLATTKGMFQVAGAITASVMPLFFVGDMSASLQATALCVILLCAVCTALFLSFMPHNPKTITRPKVSFFAMAKQGLKNTAYRNMIIIFGIIQTANALTAGLLVLYITHIIKAPQYIGLILGLLFTASALFLPVWVWISKKVSKTTAWRYSMISGCVILYAFVWLGPGNLGAAIALSVIIGAVFGCDAIMPTSMLADIVYADDETGQNLTGGTYLAFKNAVSKLTFIAPMGLAFPVLGAIGFDATEGALNSDQSRTVLILFFAIIPVILRLVACKFAVKISPTEMLGRTL